MSAWCTFLLPTRHRPAFVEQALATFGNQQDADVEIIVSDNWTDPALSCEQVARDAGWANVRYVRPASPLGMVDNWTHALQQATGEYVGVLTDKIFLQPGAVSRIRRALHHANAPELLSWVTDFYKPSRFPDYFADGVYTAVQADAPGEGVTGAFDPRAALDEKGRGAVARGEQSPSQYCRGKMVFGVYHRSLLERMATRFGDIFRDISPDYSSMVLALSEANSAAEMSASAVVSMVTDLSNGDKTSSSDVASLGYLQQLSGGVEALVADMLIPGAYASQANTVARDYLSLRREFGLSFAFDHLNWLMYCVEDLSRTDRAWSSPEVQEDQMGRLMGFINALPAAEQEQLVHRYAQRGEQRARGRIGGPLPAQQFSWAAPSLTDALRRRSAWT